MKIKIIAIGNRIMGDDGIGIQVLEAIAPRLENENTEILFVETDIDYGLSQIRDGDRVVLIDSTCFNIEAGTVTYTAMEETMKKSMTNPKIEQLQILNSQAMNPQVMNPQVMNSQAMNPQATNPHARLSQIRVPQAPMYSQHQPNLIDLLNLYQISVRGFLIGIEIEEVQFGLELSKTLKKKFSSICNEIYHYINEITGGNKMHDTFLLNKISKSLKELCKQSEIMQIESLSLEVNHDSHINEDTLLEHLKLNHADLLANHIQVDIIRSDIESQTAIIRRIQGE